MGPGEAGVEEAPLGHRANLSSRVKQSEGKRTNDIVWYNSRGYRHKRMSMFL